MEWTKKQYNYYSNETWPWIEDKYLSYFTKDNKTSYTTKEQLRKTEITGDENVNKIQEGVIEGVGGQLGTGGLGQSIGQATSKEGINRAERGHT
ncbi:MAG: hypothetical protein M1827_007599 [Pycnora praestabilis]|nr:MAG: hypothetical protein M1827_007599 [Pycnora praestabilis]